MNCNCNPPKLAIIRKVVKEGKNFGKDFFTCSTSSCQFFSWVQNPIGSSSNNSSTFSSNPPIKFQHNSNFNRFNSSTSSFNSSSSSNNNNNNNNSNKLVVRISVFSIEYKENLTIFFSLASSYSGEINSILTNLSKENSYKCNFDFKKKIWIFHFDIYERLIKSLISIKNVTLEQPPSFLINGFQSYIKRISSLPSSELNSELNLSKQMKETILPFQEEGIKFIIRRGGRGLLGDDMGCGKTIQAIALLQHYRKHWPALIVAPVNLLKQWYDEILSYSSEFLDEEDICWIRKTNDKISGKIVLIPYSIMDKVEKLKKITPQQFGFIILDESHHIKTPDAKRTLGILPFLKNAEIAICMTGTPLLNRPVEVFTQLNGLLPNVFSNYEQFVRRYCDAKPSKFGNQLDVKGSSNLSELKMILENLVMIRRLKSDVITNLPTKCREIVYIEPDENYRSEILKIQKRSNYLDMKLKESRKETNGYGINHTKLTHEKEQLLLQYYQITGMSKIKAIKEEIDKIIATSNFNKKFSLSTFSTQSEGKNNTENNKEKEEKNSVYSREVTCKPSVNNFIEKYYSNTQDKTKKNSDLGIVGEPVIMDLEEDIILIESDKEDNEGENKNELVKKEDGNKKDSIGIFHIEKKEIINDDKNENNKENEVFDLVDSDSENSPKNSKKLRKLKRNSFLSTQTSSQTLTQTLTQTSTQHSDSDIFQSVSINPLAQLAKDDSDFEEDENQENVDNGYLEDDNYEDDIENEEDDDIEEFDEEEIEDYEEDDDEMQKKKKKKLSKSKKRTSKKDENDGVIHYDPSQHVSLDHKLLIFAHHHNVLNSIEQILISSGLGFIRIDGKTNGKKKNNLLKEFKENSQISVALLSITACGTGLNLTVAKKAIFAELYWSPGVVLQAEDRIYRIGQKEKEVKICYLLAKNTADDIVWENIKKKYSILGETIGNTGELNKIGNSSNNNSSNSNNSKSTQQSLNTFLKPSQQSSTSTSLPASTISTTNNISTAINNGTEISSTNNINFEEDDEDNSALDFDPDEFIANNLKNESNVNSVTPPPHPSNSSSTSYELKEKNDIIINPSINNYNNNISTSYTNSILLPSTNYPSSAPINASNSSNLNNAYPNNNSTYPPKPVNSNVNSYPPTSKTYPPLNNSNYLSNTPYPPKNYYPPPQQFNSQNNINNNNSSTYNNPTYLPSSTTPQYPPPSNQIVSNIPIEDDDEENSALDFDPDEFIANNLKNQLNNSNQKNQPPPIGSIYDSLSQNSSQNNSLNELAPISSNYQPPSYYSSNNNYLSSNNNSNNNNNTSKNNTYSHAPYYPSSSSSNDSLKRNYSNLSYPHNNFNTNQANINRNYPTNINNNNNFNQTSNSFVQNSTPSNPININLNNGISNLNNNNNITPFSNELKVNESFKNFSTGKGQNVSVKNNEAIKNANKIFENFPYK